MDNTRTRRQQPAATIPRAPLLLRSKSGAPAISLTELHASTSKADQTTMQNRSKSTAKSRANYNNYGENVKPSSTMVSNNNKKTTSEKRESVVKSKQQQSPHSSSGRIMRPRTPSTSLSAWALSPGRAPPRSPMPELPARSNGLKVKVKPNGGGGGGGGGGGVGGSVGKVLKYFSQKKVSSTQKEEYHQFRVMHNRLLQWRFANARANAAMAAVKTVAEDKSFNVWLQIFKMRNSIMEKRIEIQQHRHEIKLYEIVKPEVLLLNEWTKLEKKNCEAVGRVVRKLSAVSVKLPLLEDVKGDLVSVCHAMSTAVGVMDDIEATITSLNIQVEILKDFFNVVKQQKECTEELRNWITIIVPLQARERSLQVYLIQAAKEQ